MIKKQLKLFLQIIINNIFLIIGIFNSLVPQIATFLNCFFPGDAYSRLCYDHVGPPFRIVVLAPQRPPVLTARGLLAWELSTWELPLAEGSCLTWDALSSGADSIQRLVKLRTKAQATCPNSGHLQRPVSAANTCRNQLGHLLPLHYSSSFALCNHSSFESTFLFCSHSYLFAGICFPGAQLETILPFALSDLLCQSLSWEAHLLILLHWATLPSGIPSSSALSR